CTSYGAFGPSTSARSDEYALYQALNAAKWVVAILPSTLADEVYLKSVDAHFQHPFRRLRAMYDMPVDVFREENATVRVTVALFDLAFQAEAAPRQRVTDLCAEVEVPTLTGGMRREPRLKHLESDKSGPAITTPVSGDPAVRVCHDGRWIKLKFQCGLTEAMVLNAIYRDRIAAHRPHDEHRYPRDVKYVGQGALDLQIHLAQPDPMRSFWDFIAVIGRAGGTPVVEAGLLRYLRSQTKATARQKTPFRHTVLMPGTGSGTEGSMQGTAKKDHLVDPTKWGSAVIKAGTTVSFVEIEHGRHRFEHLGKQYVLPYEDILARFDLIQKEAESEWKVVYPGLAVQNPKLAEIWRARIRSLGIDAWLNRGYQIDDLVELAIKRGGVVAWAMALGKARAALAIALLLGGKHSLVVLKAALVDEMLIEIRKISLDGELWQVIETPTQLQSLRRINIISVDRLKAPVAPEHPRMTYAKKLRRRVGTIIPDEAHFLGNIDTDQTSAVWQVSAKRRFPLTGTPAGNYPRDCHGLLAFAGGDGTASQPYGYRRYYLDPSLRHSMALAERGIDRVLNTFCEFVWVTREFEDELKVE
ncbi:MAG: SNF2-related protein, partial [Pseudomonadota bacterium]